MNDFPSKKHVSIASMRMYPSSDSDEAFSSPFSSERGYGFLDLVVITSEMLFSGHEVAIVIMNF